MSLLVKDWARSCLVNYHWQGRCDLTSRFCLKLIIDGCAEYDRLALSTRRDTRSIQTLLDSLNDGAHLHIDNQASNSSFPLDNHSKNRYQLMGSNNCAATVHSILSTHIKRWSWISWCPCGWRSRDSPCRACCQMQRPWSWPNWPTCRSLCWKCPALALEPNLFWGFGSDAALYPNPIQALNSMSFMRSWSSKKKNWEN